MMFNKSTGSDSANEVVDAIEHQPVQPTFLDRIRQMLRSLWFRLYGY